MIESRPKCVRCGGLVDAHGVSGNGADYCDCLCRWPNGGCGVRIFFQVNLNEKVQPFTLSTGRAHHGECPPFDAWKREQRLAAKRQQPVPEPKPPKLEDFL